LAAVRVVPHTHWDREWYLPFQAFRLKLVGLIDLLLDAMEADERYRFTLDGQLATLDDYLEVRPEAEPRIRRLVEEGRLAIGPWQTLMDEFFVSGETIVRNLEQGQRRGEELGGAMQIGYLPDMFGHVAQMPQILRLAGIDRALVWRGVPAAIDSHVFEWEAPDGSVVRTEYLPRGYGNGARLLDTTDFAAELETIESSVRSFYGDDPVLVMLGDDHREPPQRLRDGVEVMTLPDYLVAETRPSELVPWRGELRSGARANLLMGTTSARIDLKAAMAGAERALTRYAEPFQALYGGEWSERLLDLAWRRLLENSAHDSICGCSADEVSAQVLMRCAEAEQIADGLAADAAALAGRRAPAGTVVVLNPSPEPRVGLVELAGAEPSAFELPDGSLAATQAVGDGVVANVRVPPLGWIALRPVEGSGEVENPVRAGEGELDNGLLAVAVGEDGTLEVGGLRGVGRIVAGGDRGDSYNYAPAENDTVVERPDHIRVELLEPGPVRGRLAVVRSYRWQGVPVDVATSIELRTGEPFCRLRVAFVNPCSDHRVRFHIPLGEPTSTSAAEGQFAVVERGLEAEGGHGEVPLPTFPAYGFVDAGGVAVLLDHVMEYELVSGRELALTLLRSIGLISRTDHPYREVPAGPELEIPAAQLHGPCSVGFALLPHEGTWRDAGVLTQAERYRHPFLAVNASGGGDQREERGPELRGDGVVLSSLRRRNGALEARLANESPTPVAAKFGATELELRAWEVRSVELS
jgi:alpha-mannosidase